MPLFHRTAGQDYLGHYLPSGLGATQLHMLRLHGFQHPFRELGRQILLCHIGEGVIVVKMQIHIAITIAKMIGIRREVTDQIAFKAVRHDQHHGTRKLISIQRCQRQLQTVATGENAGFRIVLPLRFPGQMHHRGPFIGWVHQH